MKILYEDEDVLVVEKPAGISIEEVAGNYPLFTLAHRLDKETSGALVIAKNEPTLDSLKNQFQKRKVKKVYVAIVDGHVKKDYGVVDKPIGRTRSDPRKRHAGRGIVGKEREAVTEYKVIKRFETPEGKFTYLEIYPQTGRTHQIRVHMKFLNYPVVGDALYNPTGQAPEGLSRMALHSKSIEFNLPAGEAGTPGKKTIKVESPVPAEIEKVVK